MCCAGRERPPGATNPDTTGTTATRIVNRATMRRFCTDEAIAIVDWSLHCCLIGSRNDAE